MSTPHFKIHGKERRILKKEFNSLKSFVNDFWYCHEIDKDMASLFGSADGYPMSDEEAKNRFDIAVLKMEELEKQLSALYKD